MNTVNDYLKDTNGILRNEKKDGMKLLKAVSTTGYTVWSQIYNQDTGEVYIAVSQDFDNVRKFKLKMSR